MTLTNGSPFPITNDFDWCIYFNQDQAIYNGTEWGNRFGSDIAEGWQVFHVNGYLWKFCPSGKNFKQINSGQQKTWRLQGSDYICQVIIYIFRFNANYTGVHLFDGHLPRYTVGPA